MEIIDIERSYTVKFSEDELKTISELLGKLNVTKIKELGMHEECFKTTDKIYNKLASYFK